MVFASSNNTLFTPSRSDEKITTETFDDSFLIQQLQLSKDGKCSLAPTQELNLHKLSALRDHITKVVSKSPENILLNLTFTKAFKKNESHRVKNTLSIVGLLPTQGKAKIYCDATDLASKDSFQGAFPHAQTVFINTQKKIVIPCTVRQNAIINPRLIQDKKSQEYQRHFLCNVFSEDIEAMILNYLDPSDYYKAIESATKSHSFSDTLFKKINCKKLNDDASCAVRTALENYTGNENALFKLPTCSSRSIKELREYVTELDLGKAKFPLHLLPQLALYFPNVKTLRFCGKNTDEKLQHLSGFKNLECLDLSGSHVTGKNFDLLPRSLKQLICSECKSLQDEFLKKLQHIELKVLNINSTDIEGTGFAFLPETLEELYCQSCEMLQDDFLAGLQHTKLKKLDIALTNIAGAAFGNFPPSLEELDCTHCEELQDLSLADLQHTKLKKLDLTRTNILGTYFNCLPSTLKTLCCHSCQNLQDPSLAKLQQINLKKLNIVAAPILGTFFGALPLSLESLECRCCEKLQDSAIQQLQNHTKLKELDVSCTGISGMFFGFLPPSLEILLSYGCPELKSIWLGKLQKHPKLSKLNIAHTAISKEAFDTFPEHLEDLDCDSCQQLQDAWLVKLKKYTHLKKLNIRSTHILGTSFGYLPPSLEDLDCDWCERLLVASLYNLQHTNLKNLVIDEKMISEQLFYCLPDDLQTLNGEPYSPPSPLNRLATSTTQPTTFQSSIEAITTQTSCIQILQQEAEEKKQ